MDPSLMSPEELELRGLIRLVPQPDGSYQMVESDPKRCAELRAIIATEEAAAEDYLS